MVIVLLTDLSQMRVHQKMFGIGGERPILFFQPFQSSRSKGKWGARQRRASHPRSRFPSLKLHVVQLIPR